MSNRNQNQRFDTLIGGLEFGRADGARGTLGMLLADANGDRWAVTAAHVLAGAAVVDVLQPLISFPGRKVGSTGQLRSAAPGLDCAAVRIDPLLVATKDEILGIGPVTGRCPPVLNMRVIKCGAASGLTEGIIDDIQGDIIRVVLPPHYPTTSELTDKGDSGSIWVDTVTRQPVALHFDGNSGGPEWSRAISIDRVCQILGLNVP